MTTLLDDLQSNKPTKAPCALRNILDSLSPDEAAAVREAISKIQEQTGKGSARTYTPGWLAAVLSKHGYEICRTTVRRHLNGDCPCD